MNELFAAQQLGTVSEDRWRDWANGVQGIGYFSNSGVPDQSGFASWQDWAKSLVGIMSVGAP